MVYFKYSKEQGRKEKMEKMEMFNYYEKFNKAEKYIIGFAHKGQVYMTMVDHLNPDMFNLEDASRNQGTQLRFRPRATHKAQMLLQAVCLGTLEILLDEKYNKGEMFEKVVTEYYGQVWEKDNVPFHKAGDINVGGVEIQIKYQNAGLCTSKTLEKLLAVA
jgi:hypothetical protein